MPKQKSNRGKYLLISVFLIILLVAVIASAATMFRGANGRKPSASQYFIVTHTSSTGEVSDDNKSVILSILGVNITAVGGDATAVQVKCTSQANPVDDYCDNLAKGPPGWDLPIALTGGDWNYHGLLVRLNNQGMFQANVTISCNEAQTATIPVLINPDDIVNLPLGIIVPSG